MAKKAKSLRKAARRRQPKPTNRTMRARQNTSARAKPKRWSKRVTEQSNALDLEKSVFTYRDPKKIAASLNRSAERSTRRRSTPYQSAMSMLTFYINRAGKNLSASQRTILNKAKDELRTRFGRD